jgi:hypothetical protein
MANLNFMTIEVHSSEYIHLALCTHTLCRDNPAMLFPLQFFPSHEIHSGFGRIPLQTTCHVHARIGILHAGESANPLNIFFPELPLQ